MKNFLILGLVAAMLAGCGGGNVKSKPGRSISHGPMPTATGPISSACLTSGRSARSRQLCGCIQAVANRTLTGSEQRRAAEFYSNPQRVQDTRQSDRAGDEQFWKAYKTYGERAEQICR